MTRWNLASAATAVVVVFGIGHGDSAAQSIGVSTPFQSVGNSFYERQGVGFSFQTAGPSSAFFGGFNQGSFNSAIPPFGGYDPAADARFGFASVGDNGSFSLMFQMGKGSSRSMTGIAPSVVVPNGGVGSIFSGSLTPFVSGITPIVGNPYGELEVLANELGGSFRSTGGVFDPGAPPLTDSPGLGLARGEPVSRAFASSTAQRAVPGLAAIRQAQADAESEQAAEIARLIAESQHYEGQGDRSRARSRLRSAIKKASGPQRYELQLQLEALSDDR